MKAIGRRAREHDHSDGERTGGEPTEVLSTREPQWTRPIETPKKGLHPLASFLSALRSFKDLRRTPYGLTPLLLLATVGFFQRLDTTAFALAAPEFIKEGVSVISIIRVSITIGILTLFASLGLAWYADRHKRVPIFAVGTVISGIGAMATGLRSSSATAVGTARVVDDVANAGADTPLFSLLADYYPPEVRGRVFAFLATLRRFGQLIAPFAAAVSVVQFGLRTTFILFGIPIVIIGIVALLRLREPVRGYFERQATGASEEVSRKEDEPQSFGESWRTVFSVRTLRRLFLSSIVIDFVDSGILFFTGLFLVERYGLNILERASISIPAVLAALVGGIYGGGLVDRFTQRNPGRVLSVYGAFSFVTALGYVGFSFEPRLGLLIAFGAVTAFGSAMVGPAALAVYSQIVPPTVRTLGLQVTNLSALSGFLFGFSTVALIRNEYGYQTMFLFAVPFYIVGGIIAISAGGFFAIDRRSALATTVAAEDWRMALQQGDAKMLVCRDVDVEYDGVQVLFGVDFTVGEGELVALLGTNGAGKSTLLRAISGTQEASSGAIVFDGRDITHMPPHEIAGRNVVHMPGGRGTFPGLSVRENLLLATWSLDDPNAAQAALAEALEIFPNLRERIDTPAAALSGGEQQQLSLAQAFLMKPKLLMIDELSLGLSPAVVGQLLEIVKEINGRGVAIIVVEQSVNVALNLARRAVFMEKGEIRFDGPTADLLARPDILRAVYVKGTGALTDGAPAAARRSERDQRALELSSSRALLEVRDITKSFGGIHALKGVSLDLREGEVLGIIGPNGSGKTTLFDVISGFQKPDSGTVRFEGVDITSLSPEERSRRKMIRRFQDARLFPSLTVYETLLVSLEQRLEVKSSLLNAAAFPQARRAERRLRARADRLVELLELGSYRDNFVKELSTGLRRILDLACVLAAEPRLLLLDEPSSGVAQAEAEGLAPLLGRVRFETGCSILIIEHDMPLISAVSDELLALEQGEYVTRGAPEDVLNNERVIEAYLGGSEAAIKRSGSTA